MAAWMLYRCVFGPRLQRIHRSPEPSRPEGRLVRRVGDNEFYFVLELLRSKCLVFLFNGCGGRLLLLSLLCLA